MELNVSQRAGQQEDPKTVVLAAWDHPIVIEHHEPGLQAL